MSVIERSAASPTPAHPKSAYARSADERVNKLTSIPFIIVHLIPLLVVFTGITIEAVVLGVVTYVGRMFFITAGYHRYFSHRSYRMPRVPQFLMAFGGTTAAQKGPLWWAGHHRHHHRTSDTPEDVHSPLRGFWWSHVGWILCDKYADTPTQNIKDFAKFPELRFLNRLGAGVRLLLHRRVVGSAHRVLPVDGAVVARHVRHQLAGTRHGTTSLRHRGHVEELGGACAHDPR